MFVLLALLPSVVALLACAVAVPVLVAWHCRRATRPQEAPAPSGWALALDEALDADAVAEALEWPAPPPARSRKVRARSSSVAVKKCATRDPSEKQGSDRNRAKALSARYPSGIPPGTALAGSSGSPSPGGLG